MARDAVVVLAYWRPDYIGKCLDSLLACPEIQDCGVLIFQDTRKSLPANRAELAPRTTNIIEEKLPLFAHGEFIQHAPHDYTVSGTSPLHPGTFNVREGLMAAYASEAELTYLVFDDVLVTSDFLRWHKAVQQDGDYFVTCSARVPREYSPTLPAHDLSAYCESPIRGGVDNGLCWKRDKLGIVVNAPSFMVTNSLFPHLEKPMIPFVQRSYHVGRRSAAVYSDDFDVCGDVDDIPTTMPQYQWDKVKMGRL